MGCTFKKPWCLYFQTTQTSFTSTIYHFHVRKPVSSFNQCCWHNIFLHLPLKICSLRFFKKRKKNNIFLKIIIFLLYAPLCFACPLPLAWFLNAPWGTKCEHKLLGRRDRTRMVEWIMGLSSDFERALERSPERRLWFSYLPNTFLHVPCGWLVEHHNLPSSVCLVTSLLCNWYAWHSHTMGHVWKLVPWCWLPE